MSENMAMIRVDVMLDNLRQQIMTALSSRTLDLESVVSQQIERALTSEKVLAAIQDEVSKQVLDTIKWRVYEMVREAMKPDPQQRPAPSEHEGE